MKYLLLFILIVQVVTTVKSQIPEGYYYKDENKNIQKIDSLLRISNEELPKSYYVITYPVGEKITSFGMQLYKSYHSVRDEKKKIVLLLSNLGGIRKSDVYELLKNLLKIDEQELQNILIVWDKDVYRYVVRDRRLVRLLYIYRNDVYYNENQKLHSFAKFSTPEPTIEIKEQRSIKLLESKGYILKGSDSVFPYKNGHLLVIGDLNNALFDLDINSGIVKPIFEINKYFTPYEIFYKEIVKDDSARFNLAKDHNDRLVESNRQTIQLSQVRYKDEKIFGTFSIEVTEINDKNDSYISDEGEVIIHKSGVTILNHYLFFFCWDPESKKILAVSEIKNPYAGQVYTNIDCGFYLKGNTLYTGVTRYPAPTVENGHIASYELIDNEPVFQKYIGPLTKEDKFLSNYNFIDHFYEFGGSLMYSYTCQDEICEVGKDKAVSHLFGDGTRPFAEQTFKNFNEQSLIPKLNFMIGMIQPVFNDEYILAFYRYKDKYIFELKDLIFNTAELIDATSIKGMDSYINQGFPQPYPNGIIIQDDKIYCIILEDNDLILRTFSILKY